MSVDVVLALQALAHDVHVQQAEEAAAEAEAERLGHLRLPRQRGVVELELLERVAQVGVLVGVDRKQAAEDDRLDVAVARQRLEVAVARPAVLRRQRVADGERRHLLDAGDDEADLAGRRAGRSTTIAGVKKPMSSMSATVSPAIERMTSPFLKVAVDDADVRDDAAVLVELGVEDQRARRPVRIARGRRHPLDELLEHVDDAVAGLAGDPQDVVDRLAEQVGDLLGDALGLGARQVELVEHRDELEAVLDREVRVRDGLRLDALRRVDDEQRALARGERAADLVGEVDVAGRVDEVQLVGLAVARLVEDAHRLRLDRDPALALEVHRVEHLRAHRARVDGLRHLEDAIGQRRLPVVDVGDDREVADVCLVGHGARYRVGRAAAIQRGVRRSRRSDRVADLLRLGHAQRSTAKE